MSRPLTPYERISMEIDENSELDEKEKIELKLKMFNKFIAWTDNDYIEYNDLLSNLKRIKRKRNPSKSELGLALETVVNFIFEKSYFYKVFENKRTSTHEIDQFVILSDRGIQAIEDYNFPKKLLLTEQDYLLCECKNYKKNVAATWVGKFNTLLEVSGKCQLGIVFSCDGLTGQENNWYDAHGLTKVIYHLSAEDKKRYILDFNLTDFDKLKDKKNNIYNIIKSKKATLCSNVKSENLLEDLHDGNDDVVKIYNQITQ